MYKYYVCKRRAQHIFVALIISKFAINFLNVLYRPRAFRLFLYYFDALTSNCACQANLTKFELNARALGRVDGGDRARSRYLERESGEHVAAL